MTSLCAKCGGSSSVVDSRVRDGGVIRRRRGCESCGWRWNTEEVTVGSSRQDLLRARTEAKRKLFELFDQLLGDDKARMKEKR